MDQKTPRKSRKEYDLFKTVKKELLGDDYPEQARPYSNKHWSVDDFKTDLATRYGEGALTFVLRLDRKTMLTPAYIGLSVDGRALYTMCLNQTEWEGRKYDKRNGGRGVKEAGKPKSFLLPYNLVMAYGGFASKSKISKAFKELIALKFIRQVNQTTLGEANIYKLTPDFEDLSEAEVAAIKEQLNPNKKQRFNPKRVLPGISMEPLTLRSGISMEPLTHKNEVN